MYASLNRESRSSMPFTVGSPDSERKNKVMVNTKNKVTINMMPALESVTHSLCEQFSTVASLYIC